jgi:hypothetical protein
MNRLIYFLIALIIGYIITTGTYSIFSYSVFNSIPILGDVLTGFDIAYIIQHRHAGMELNEAANHIIRILNVTVSVLVWYFFNLVLDGMMQRVTSKIYMIIQGISFFVFNLLFSYFLNILIFKNIYEVIKGIIENLKIGIFG